MPCTFIMQKNEMEVPQKVFEIKYDVLQFSLIWPIDTHI